MTNNDKARELLKTRTDDQLIEIWELTEKAPYSRELIITRGWIMDEMERRFPEAFNNWLENCEYNDDFRSYIN